MNKQSITSNEKFKSSPFGEKYLYSLNRNTFSTDISSNVFSKHFSNGLLKDDRLYIIIGSDSGLLIKYIGEQGIPNNTRYLFIELPCVINKIESEINLNNESIKLTTPENWQKVAKEMELNVYIYKDKISYIKSLSAVDCYNVDYQSYNQEIIKSLESTFFFTRALVGVFPFMTKQLMNISENKYSSTLLNGLFKDKTCVLLGGGPSLDNHLEWLIQNKNNLVIIAVSRIAKTLIKHDLPPHIIVSVDPYDVSFDVSKELLNLPKEVIFLHANCVNSLLLSQWHGKSVSIGARFPWQENSDKPITKMGGPTVINTALKCAVEMGFSNILLSGVDLCYSKSGISHSADSNEANTGPTLGQPGMWVETYAGHKAETHMAFHNAIEALEVQAKSVQKDGINIYNLSENAAKANYIEHIPVAALSFANEKNDIHRIFELALPKMDINTIRQDNNNILDKTSKMLRNMQKIKGLAEEALNCNEKLFKVKGKESDNFKYKLQMDKIEHKFDSTYKKTTDFIKNFGLDKFIKCVHTSHDSWSDEKIEETGRVYYQAYVDTVNNLITHLKGTVQRIKSRISEEAISPNVNLLIEQWNKDKHYGRALVWQKKHSEIYNSLTSETQAEFKSLITKFNNVMNAQATAHLARTQQHASLGNVKRKIITLFHQDNIDGLKTMATSLSLYEKNSKNTETVSNLYNLSSAFMYVLEEKYNEALDAFNLLPENQLEEDELHKIAIISIKLEQYNKAEMILKRLSEINDTHIPFYAKILSLQGKVDQSLDIYTEYLTSNPEEHHTWLALGELYFKIEAFDSAKMAFHYVLNKDPINTLALTYLNKLP